jgi:hypothetical protein
VGRGRVLYFSFLVSALALFGIAAALTSERDGGVGFQALVRFMVVLLGIGTAVATWVIAVVIASVHKRTWALFVTVGVVVVAALVFAATRA